MGGYSYDRDVYSSSSSWGSSYGSSSSWGSSYGSSYSSAALSADKLDASMSPNHRTLISSSKHPIILMLDVTGSNTSFAKIVYDKAPMFYGQIEQNGYFKDFDISVCAVGDTNTDDYPLQIADFAKGIEIDSWLKKLVLEGGGGGQMRESYELAAYFLLHHFQFSKEAQPFIFFLADESPYRRVDEQDIKNKLGDSDITQCIDSRDVFHQLLDKVPNTYVFLNPYCGRERDEGIYNDWKDMFPVDRSENIIRMKNDNEKAIIDLILGILAMIGEAEDSLEDYKVTMMDRGQTVERIASVSGMLDGVSKSLTVRNNVKELVTSDKNSSIRNNRNKRL